ncbi:MAG TPA: hypothetical protein VFA53_07630 [Xanthobacteraceae bacterium]|nr:hypothetical protein [Xanthobacteraceae bacterium]
MPKGLYTGVQRAAERAERAVRVRWHQPNILERRRLAERLSVRPGLPRLDEERGYGLLPPGTIREVGPAIRFVQELCRERGFSAIRERKKDYRATILAPRTYEEAPAIFDLAFSDDALSIAVDYLGEIPVLHNIEVWATPTNQMTKGSQYYHRDGGGWYLRRAKFLFNMIEVGPQNGPFTFLPAHVSDRVARANGRITGRFEDEEIFRIASRTDEVALTGPEGTGAVVDSSRCFHFGSRAREGTRVMIMFHFLRFIDLVQGGDLRRTAGFRDRFGDDPLRNLIVPNQ